MVSGYPRVSVGFPCAACLSLGTRRARVSAGFPRRARAALDSQLFFALVARSCFRNMSEILGELLFLRSRISTLAEFEDEVHRGFSPLLGGTFATALSVSYWSVGAKQRRSRDGHLLWLCFDRPLLAFADSAAKEGSHDMVSGCASSGGPSARLRSDAVHGGVK